MTRFGFGKFLSVACLAVLASSTAAFADTMYFNTPTNHAGAECCFEVDLHQVTSKEVQVTVTLLDGATFFASTGSGQHPGFGFNLAGDPSVTLSGYNTTDWTGSATSVTTGGPALGDFDYQFNLNSSGTSGKITSLVFDVTTSSAISASASSFTSNADGIQFVADILGADGGTGLSGIRGPVVTPEPSSLFLLGTGILGAGLLVRNRTKSARAKA